MTSRRAPAAVIVAAGSLAVFCVVFALLAFQLRAGRDPALSAASASVPAAPPVRRVIQRRIVIRKVIIHVRPREDDTPAPATRTVTAAAPAPAPVQAAAPAPAPAPAPLVTRTS
jgi:hypothetical protein